MQIPIDISTAIFAVQITWTVPWGSVYAGGSRSLWTIYQDPVGFHLSALSNSIVSCATITLPSAFCSSSPCSHLQAHSEYIYIYLHFEINNLDLIFDPLVILRFLLVDKYLKRILQISNRVVEIGYIKIQHPQFLINLPNFPRITTVFLLI